MPKQRDSEIVGRLRQQIELAHGATGDELSANREKALDYYYGRPRGDEIAGRSQVQSLDLADMTEAIMAQVMPSFAGDRVCEFEPNGPEDEGQAQAESDAVNHVLMESNRGYVVFAEAIKDALLLRNGIVKVWVEENDDSRTVQYDGLSDIQVTELLAGTPNITREATEAEAQDGGRTRLKVRETFTRRRLRAESIDPIEFLIEKDYDSIFLTDARFCAERKFYTRSELVELGYPRKLVEELRGDSLDNRQDQIGRNVIAPDRPVPALSPGEHF